MIMTITGAKKWLGEKLDRPGPISERTWGLLRGQGVPVGRIGNMEFCSADALEAWLEAKASTPSAVLLAVDVAAEPLLSRRRGRPRKTND